MRRLIVALLAVVLTTSFARSQDHAPWPVDWSNWSDPALWVTVGNPGNAADKRYDSTGYGAVNHVYKIGKFEVTAGQYTEFLNAVAKADTYGLYDTAMGDPNGWAGCGIQRTVIQGTCIYSVGPDWTNRPVNSISFYNACRFANWLHNGQPTGAQGPGNDGGRSLHRPRQQDDSCPPAGCSVPDSH